MRRAVSAVWCSTSQDASVADRGCWAIAFYRICPQPYKGYT
jgi:hypothetical protein